MLSADELREFIDQISRDKAFEERDNEYIYRRELLNRRRNVVLPNELDPRSQWRDPILRVAANKYKNRMLAAPVKINVAARSQSDRSIERARRQESYFYRCYHRWRDQGRFDGPLFSMAAYGVGWLYLTLNRDLLPDLPDMKDGEDPEEYLARAEPIFKNFTQTEHLDLFVPEHAQSDTVYWTQGSDTLCQRAIVPYHKLARDYHRRGKAFTEENGKIEIRSISGGENVMTGGAEAKWDRTVELYTCTDKDYIYHLIQTGGHGNSDAKDIELLDCYPNFFGMPAFFRIAADDTGDPHPLDAFTPLIDGLYATVPFKNIAQSAKLYAGLETSEQRYALEKIDPSVPDLDPGTIEIRVVEGVLLPPDGYRIVNPGISTGPDLMDAVNIIDGEQQRYDYPKELGSPGEVTANSGYERAQQQDTVASLLNPPLEHFAAMLRDRMFPAVANAVKRINVPLAFRDVKARPAGGMPQDMQDIVTINPADIIDAEITVGFSSLTIFNRIALQEEGMKMMEHELMNEFEFITEVRDVDDYEAWALQRDIDKMKKFDSERAITDVQAAIDQMRGVFQQDAMIAAGVNPLLVNSDMSRADRGPSVPSGPGAAMPIAPTPPGMGDGAVPVPSGGI